MRPDYSKLLCNGGFQINYVNNSSSQQTLRIIVVCQVSTTYFDPVFISHFPNLYRLSVINSPNISKFFQPFPTHKLQVLNLTRLGLTHLSHNTFEGLKHLKILDLSHNKLKSFDRHIIEHLPELQQIFLRHNNWDCDNHLKWVLNSLLGKKLMDATRMTCATTKFKGKPVIAVMQFFKALRNECPKVGAKSCNCSLDLVVWSPNRDYLVPVTTVNCSRLGLEEMPHSIPSNTTTLLLRGNKITDVSPLVTNPKYLEVSDIYLDENDIRNIDKLEGAAWLTKFRVFSLKSNKITLFQTFALENGFRKNGQIGKIYFGNNPWTCDCTFTPSFKDLIIKYYDLIEDIDDIRCAFAENDDNSMKIISDLKLSSICVEPSSFLSLLDCLNILLACLIVFILLQLLYDYWIYKSSGKLPWIITKIP